MRKTVEKMNAHVSQAFGGGAVQAIRKASATSGITNISPGAGLRKTSTRCRQSHHEARTFSLVLFFHDHCEPIRYARMLNFPRNSHPVSDPRKRWNYCEETK